MTTRQSRRTLSLPLAITMGDPAGIGPEIVVRLFAEGLAVAGDGSIPIVIGDMGSLERAAHTLGVTIAIRRIEPQALSAPAQDARAIRVVQPTVALAPLPHLGVASAVGGRAAYDWVIAAARLALDGHIAGIVTAPINKSAWHLAGLDVPGHTELLAEAAGTEDFGMMLANDDLRVMLVSIHVPLARAVELVTRGRVLAAIRLAARGASELGVVRPRIAVAGLNPHAGEGGLFGREDIEHIAPAITDAQAAGIVATGPHSPDTVFMRARQGEFDAVVAQYHDQGLIPIKYLGIERGVNVTVGLPFVRTSVDHGTAYDIAGSGKASAASLAYALRAAERMAAVRAAAAAAAR